MNPIVISYHGKTYILPNQPTGVSVEADYSKLWLIATQDPSTPYEFEQAHTLAQYWYNVKYIGMTYHPKIMIVLKRFDSVRI